MFCDIVITSSEPSDSETDAVLIPCHKAVLASSSLVFKAMLESGFKEASENLIKIQCQEDVLASFVEFFYSKTISKDVVEKHYEKLLYLSEEYDLDLLKMIVMDVMLKNLTTETMVEYFLLGDLYNCQEIKEASKKFILSNKEYFKSKDLGNKLKDEISCEKLVDILNILI